MHYGVLLVILGFGFTSVAAAQPEPAGPVERWGIHEIALNGPASGNPFLDVWLTAEFQGPGHTITADGFYDGSGIYRVRFTPPEEGPWTYATKSNRPELDGKTGGFLCAPPAPDNRGPVQVRDTFRFSYADGAPHFSVGTTCYAWTHQGEVLEAQTLATLKESPFNKLRMCVFPKHYSYNRNEPVHYPFPRNEAGENDFSRFNPAHFQHFEQRVGQLRDLGIEADIILLHPYDRWGYAEMDKVTTDRYLRYVVARLSAYRNVWWSMANEYDLMENYEEADWDHFFQVVRDADPYDRLRSIHNCRRWYDHTKPWVTHVSLQTSDFADAGEYRARYQKPIVFDECRYEGNVRQGWGNISAERMTYNFWAGSLAGCYVGHGETYEHPQDILWWAKGGVLHGESPARIAFLRRFVEGLPYQDMKPDFSSPGNFMFAKAGELYLVFFGSSDEVRISLAGNRPYKVDGIDPWKMTVEPLGTAMPGEFRMAPLKENLALRLTPYGAGEAMRPEAQATCDQRGGHAPLRVQFAGPAELACHWEFGDGTISEARSPDHVYAKAGQYVARLKVTDAAGLSGLTAVPVTVLPPVPTDLDGGREWPGLEEGLCFEWPGTPLEARDDAALDARGAMALRKGAFLAPQSEASLVEAAQNSHQLTIETVLSTEDMTQSGPARIITLSEDHGSRLFTLGQQKDKLVLRLRTTSNGGNATDPMVTLCRLETGKPVHVVASYFPGYLAAYVNGEPVLKTAELRGDFSNWEPGHHLLFGDEWVGGRAWTGSLEGVAIYSRFVGAEEAGRKYELWKQR